MSSTVATCREQYCSAETVSQACPKPSIAGLNPLLAAQQWPTLFAHILHKNFTEAILIPERIDQSYRTLGRTPSFHELKNMMEQFQARSEDTTADKVPGRRAVFGTVAQLVSRILLPAQIAAAARLPEKPKTDTRPSISVLATKGAYWIATIDRRSYRVTDTGDALTRALCSVFPESQGAIPLLELTADSSLRFQSLVNSWTALNEAGFEVTLALPDELQVPIVDREANRVLPGSNTHIQCFARPASSDGGTEFRPELLPQTQRLTATQTALSLNGNHLSKLVGHSLSMQQFSDLTADLLTVRWFKELEYHDKPTAQRDYLLNTVIIQADNGISATIPLQMYKATKESGYTNVMIAVNR